MTLDARDEHGQLPLQDRYTVSGRLVIPGSFVPLPRITARTIVVDDLGDDVTLLLGETWHDRAANKLYAVSHHIELIDVAGNTAAYDLESAFSIGEEDVPRRRGVGK